ncbi:unnamed protein product [Durusdinium trenchii]|uniref:Uncharacterized protein n=1 Tax=Durusdinium trenchii TaxID=1381693 RepID=A0ABP0QEP5_9DINO
MLRRPWRPGRWQWCRLASTADLCVELHGLAARGALAAAERRLSVEGLPGQSTPGALVAASCLPPKYRGTIFRCLLLAAINADDADAASRWLTGFARFLPDASSRMTTLEERGLEERGPSGLEVLGRLLGVVSEGGPQAAERWFLALEGSGPLAELLRHRVMVRSGDFSSMERSLACLPALQAPCEDRATAVEQALERIAKGSDPGRVHLWLWRFDSMASFIDYIPGVAECSSALLAAARMGDVPRAEYFLQRCTGARSLRSWLASATKEQMVEMLDNFNLLLFSCAMAHEAERAQLWLQCLRERHEPNFQSFSHVMNSCAAIASTRTTEHYFQEMIRSQIEATANEYTILLRACGKVGDSRRASCWISRMEEACVEVDVFGLNALLAAQAGEADHTAALNLLDEMCAGSQPAMPDAVSYSYVAYAFSTAALSASRRQLLQNAEDILLRSRAAMLEVDGNAYRVLLRRSARLGDAERAGRLWRDMKLLDHDPGTSALLEVLQAASSAPFLGLAQEAFQALPATHERREDSLLLVIRPLAELGDWRGIERMLQRWGPGPQTAAVARLQLQALSEAVPRKRQRSMEAASKLLLAGEGILGETAELLHRALGGGRSSASAALPVLLGPLQQRQAALLCASRTKAALDLNDPERAEGWVRRWVLLQDALTLDHFFRLGASQ